MFILFDALKHKNGETMKSKHLRKAVPSRSSQHPIISSFIRFFYIGLVSVNVYTYACKYCA